MTLPELMVVVVILGVLSSSAVATYKERVAAARSTEAVAMLSVVQKSAERGVAIADAYGASALNLQVNTFGAAKSFGKGNNKGNKDADLDNDGNNGHGNNEGKCDPSNPGKSKNCEGGGSWTDPDGGSDDDVGNGNGNDKGNKDADLDNDGNNGHGNNEGKCDPSNPGNGKDCGGSDPSNDTDSDSGDDVGNDNNNDNGNDSGQDSGPGSDPGNGDDNQDADLDNDGDNGHGNNEDKCDPSNPGNSKDCEDPGVGSTGLCGSAQPVPSDFAKVKGATYAASGSDYASGDGGNGWKCLGASRSGNQHYQYGYDLGEGTVSGSSESYTAWARGDLDGDGRNSLFRMRGENVDGNVIHAPTIEIVDGTE